MELKHFCYHTRYFSIIQDEAEGDDKKVTCKQTKTVCSKELTHITTQCTWMHIDITIQDATRSDDHQTKAANTVKPIITRIKRSISSRTRTMFEMEKAVAWPK